MYKSRNQAMPIAAALILLVGSANATDSTPISPADKQAVQAVNDAYRKAWLANDAEGVRRLFTDDAVLLPHHGVDPVQGMRAINDFWWPSDAPPTTVTKLEMTAQEIGGQGDIAYVWGRAEVAWTSGNGGGAKTFSNRGTYLSILRRQPAGGWKISHHMWDDPPIRTTR
jgi:uncharacterized protein (TIGR02246 family)